MIDDLTRHQIYIQRYATSEIKKMLPILNAMLKKVRAEILIADGVSIARLSVLQADIVGIVNASMQKLGKDLLVDLTEFGTYEAAFTTQLMQGYASTALAGVSADQISAAVNNSLMRVVSGKNTAQLTIDQAVVQFAGSTSKSVNTVIRSGIAAGQNTIEIAESVDKLVKNRSAAQAEALIRTSANHIGSMARAKVYEENSDIIENEEFMAVLDNRTTLTCAGHDGKFYGVGEPPYPPLHFNCRSIRVPNIKDEYLTVKLNDDRLAKGADGRTTVSGRTDFDSFLRRQPASFQDEYFSQFTDGEEKAKLFRKGKLKIEKFTDAKGSPLTLDELKAREPLATNKANI